MKRPALALALVCAFAAGSAAMAAWSAARHPHAAAIATAARPRPAPAAASPATVPPTPAAPHDAWPSAAPSPEQVLYAQPELLDREAAALRPATPGKVNLYAIVFAGDGSENVFRNEAEYFDELFSRRFGAAGHVLVLENNPATLATRPLATWTNLEDALDAIAAKMDPKRDILLLYFTTHGSEDHTLLVDMDPLPLDQIGATDLPGILGEHPFRYKVVIVNACYSGGFIPPLKGPDTMVISATRTDRASFGCGEQSELTWFGHAFLVDALNRTDNLRDAFARARARVATWEHRDGFEPSDPQIAYGRGIVTQLAKWRAGFTPGDPVAFKPASTASGGAQL